GEQHRGDGPQHEQTRPADHGEPHGGHPPTRSTRGEVPPRGKTRSHPRKRHGTAARGPLTPGLLLPPPPPGLCAPLGDDPTFATRRQHCQPSQLRRGASYSRTLLTTWSEIGLKDDE